VQRATKNAENLALILANRSIRENSSEEAVFAALKSYACEAVTSFSVSPSDFDSIIDAVCTATAESYEFILSHFVKRITG
jgi:hypothetical protein